MSLQHRVTLMTFRPSCVAMRREPSSVPSLGITGRIASVGVAVNPVGKLDVRNQLLFACWSRHEHTQMDDLTGPLRLPLPLDKKSAFYLGFRGVHDARCNLAHETQLGTGASQGTVLNNAEVPLQKLKPPSRIQS